MNERRSRTEHLSEAGAARRDAMLQTLQGAVVHEARRRRRRRAVVRATAGAAALIAVVTVGALLVQQGGRSGAPSGPVAGGPDAGPPPPPEDPPAGPERAQPAPPTTPTIVRIRTDETTLQRYRVGESVDASAYAISDGELLDTLAAMGRPTGLIRSEGRVWLTAAVTDDELAAPSDDRPRHTDG